MRRVWRHKTDDYIGIFFGIVAGRVIYSHKRDGQPVLTALGGESGKRAWQQVFARGDVRWVSASSSSLYLEGMLARRLDARTGEMLAEKDLGSRARPSNPGTTYVVYWTEEPIWLIGVDPDTLEPKWRWRYDGPGVGVHEGFLCQYTADGRMRLVDVPSLADRASTVGPPRAELGTKGHAHVGDLWCEFYDKQRVGIDSRSGAAVWRREESDFGYHQTVRFVGDVAYSGERGLSAYHLTSGALLWRQNFERDVGWLSSSPHVVDGRIYVGSNDSAFHVLDARTGKVLLSHKLDFEPREVVPLGADCVVAASSDEIACFHL